MASLTQYFFMICKKFANKILSGKNRKVISAPVLEGAIRTTSRETRIWASKRNQVDLKSILASKDFLVVGKIETSSIKPIKAKGKRYDAEL